MRAVVFDLDGVLTPTAAVHEEAWRDAFNDFLVARGGDADFSADDYLTYVDGRARVDGVTAFLRSRGITLPLGDPFDPPSHTSIHGVGNGKNAAFLRRLQAGIAPYPGSAALVDSLRASGVRIAVASSSKNATAVLTAAGLRSKVDAVVDGNVAVAIGLRGKPAPDLFVRCCDVLGIPPHDAVAVEDATVGVAACRAGGFGLVLGVARGGATVAAALRAGGAHVVVPDLSHPTTATAQDLSALHAATVAGGVLVGPEAVWGRDASTGVGGDGSTVANLLDWRPTGMWLELRVDFAKKVVEGTVRIGVRALRPLACVVLDCGKNVAVNAVALTEASGSAIEGGGGVTFARVGGGDLGDAIAITLPTLVAPHADTSILLTFSSPSPPGGGGGLQWLDPPQTDDGVAPMLVSQFQPALARTAFPCADSPAAKSPWRASVAIVAPAPDGVRVLMSAPAVGDDVAPGAVPPGGVWEFWQQVAVPPYLVALAVGRLESAAVGESGRMRVWASPGNAAAFAAEMAPAEWQLEEAERLLGPWGWGGRWDMVVMPRSFPYGGMENPNLTFITPAAVGCCGAGLDVVAHEMAHSWSGNGATPASWDDFWLSEGLTTYIERHITAGAAVRRERFPPDSEGDEAAARAAVFDFEMTAGDTRLTACLAALPQAYPPHPFSALVPRLGGRDPDDAFSSVAYERGAQLLCALARRAAGGHADVIRLVRTFVTANAGGAVTRAMFRAAAHSVVPDAAAALNWDAWLFQPGAPPEALPASREAARAAAKVDVWAGGDDEDVAASVAEARTWRPQVLGYALDLLLAARPRPSVARLEALEKALGLDESGTHTPDVAAKWLRVGVESGRAAVFPAAATFAGRYGRMLYCRPLLRALAAAGLEGRRLAAATFRKHHSFYHPVAAKMLTRDLAEALKEFPAE